MGSLSLPSSGMVYVDANAVIYSVERIEPYHSLLRPMWSAAGIGSFGIVTSEMTLLEVLVGPFKKGNAPLEAEFRTLLLKSANVFLIRITQDVLEQAARLRATANLKTPDAIHAATSLLQGCVLFVTNDATFRRVPGLPAAVLSELAAP